MYLLLYVGVKHGHTYFKEIWCRDVDCTPLVGSYEHRNEHSSFLKRGEFLDHLSDNMSKKDAIPVSCIKSWFFIFQVTYLHVFELVAKY
jgi:hypothetical protein